MNESAMPILEANSRFVAAFHFQPQDVSIVSVSARLISNERCGCSAGSASRSKFVTDLHARPGQIVLAFLRVSNNL